MDLEAVIGLETHVQLNTKSKIFTGASAAFGGEPNEYIDPLTLGLPGSLPVLNKQVVECAILLGLATSSEIRRFNRFARKHYFYPDLPKGYQISQYDEPICERGRIIIEIDNGTRSIGLKRIHMEEDAGKSIHDTRTASSLIDLNRAGVALLEIVSEPDIRSPQEAGLFMKHLRQLVRWLGISDGNMEEGSLRCDANISLRPRGELKFGTRTEIKNLNSFKFVERALEYEIARQYAILKQGGTVLQETLSFDPATGATSSMRSKEESSDYRYFPDSDLPYLVIEESWIERVKHSLPKLSSAIKAELMEQYGLSNYDAAILTSDRAVVDFFQEAFAVCGNAKATTNWITSEIFGALNKQNLALSDLRVTAKDLGELIKLVDAGDISGKMAKTVFSDMFSTGDAPDKIIEKKGLRQIKDVKAIDELVNRVMAENPSELEKFVQGNDRMLAFFVGQSMKLSQGSANPVLITEAIQQKIKSLRKG